MQSVRAFLIVAFASIALWSFDVRAQSVPEVARRHMVRGQTAVELAKSPADLDDAKREFKKAIEYAPRWAQPHYELAIIQEQTGQFKDAAASLRNYLRLSPKDANAKKIRERIYKLEYKAEQTLSVSEVIDVLTSGFSLSGDWVNITKQPLGYGSATKREGGCRVLWMELVFKRQANDVVQVLESEMYYQPARSRYQQLIITGPAVKYFTMVNVCGPSNRGCDSVMQNEVEVVSKNQVNVKQTVLQGGDGAGVADGDTFSCTYQKTSSNK